MKPTSEELALLTEHNQAQSVEKAKLIILAQIRDALQAIVAAMPFGQKLS